MKLNQYAQAHAVADELEAGIQKAVTTISGNWDAPIELAYVFAAGYAAEDIDRLLPDIRSQLSAEAVIGCTCESAIGGALELESQSAISIWAASLPNASLQTFRLDYQRTPDGGVFTGWPDQLQNGWPGNCKLLLLGDPFSFPADVLVHQLNEDRPDVEVIGGMCSGASRPGECRLLLNDQTHAAGAIATLLSEIDVDTVVSQGCRPIGKPFVVTAAERNVVMSLGGKPALEQLQALFSTLPTREQRMIQSGLHLGIVMNEYQPEFSYGDFLIRNVIGIDPDSQAIQIGDFIRPGQTVQFHIRDAESASHELAQMLKRKQEKQIQSALIFTCNGRGTHLFPDPHHDAQAVQTAFGDIPSAGFFAAGEIGPVGGQNFVHGFTASLALFP
jgi:small ligand-binding sensory domain FIST